MPALEPAIPSRDESGSSLLLRIICLVVAIAIGLPGLRLLSRIWEQSEFLGHGYLVPVVAALLLYQRRASLRTALRSGEPPAFGFVIALAAAFFEVLAISGEIATAAGVGIPLLLAATAYAIGGAGLFRVVRMPIVLLVFMVPIPGFLLDLLLLKLKLFVTWVSVTMLQTFGLTVTAIGTQIVLPQHTLYVADACSGLTSITTLLPLAVIIAAVLSHGVWRRMILIASIVPLAVGGNILRILVTVSLVSRWGAEAAQGLLHESFGLTSFILGTVSLLALAKVLR